MPEKQKLSRRQFLIQSVFSGAAVAIPLKTAQAGSIGIVGANDRIRLGIIGLSDPACRKMEILAGFQNVEIAAVCDSNPNRAGFFASMMNAGGKRPLQSNDPRRIFDLQDIDAVCVAAPWKQRSELAFKALEHEKDLFIDAPFCLTLAESRKLNNLSQKSNRIVILNENHGLYTNASFAEKTRIFESDFLSVIGEMEFGNKVDGLRSPNSKELPLIFPEQSYALLDAGRTIIGAGLPSVIRSFGGEGLPRRSVEFEFSTQAGKKKSFILEMNYTHSNRSKSFETLEPRSSALRFFSSKGIFEIYTDSQVPQAIDEAVLSKFITSIKERPVKDVSENLEEAGKSTALLQLANLSARQQKHIYFDEINEKIINDYEINELSVR